MTTSRKTPILLTGATGYIGGAVLAHLLNHPNASNFEICTIVRNSAKASALRSKFGVNVVEGTFQDLDKVESLAEKSHVIFHLADADDESFMKAILAGMRKRHVTLGDLPVLIHTASSGTGVIVDDARGAFASETIYNDNDVTQMKSIPDTAFHRNVDLLVFNADTEGYIRGNIVAPSTVYGIAKNALVNAGVANDHSIQIPILVRASLARGRAGVVGEGKAIWPDVHIDDLAGLYISIFNAIVNKPDTTGHGFEGFYFGENGEHSWMSISCAIGDAMVALGYTSDASPSPFSTEELIKYFGSEAAGLYSGTNARCRADRGRALGWKPKYTTLDMLKSVRDEVEHYGELMKGGKLDFKFEPAAGK
ncbi:NAD-P-binding protein [Epithele typhae]|uniref:NAD-P-binding protein n=1 Tax=Epithele typhae TaxID=378194 RepID=UPI0020079343|nr:NAD-P-binding protein [Epithele typhae]KAH9945010.1 NAD-P-binding protein [Epithele typhae]